MDEFKKGQGVTVLLDKEHSTEGESVDHKAKFIGYHLDRQWADVELEAEHAGGTKRLSVPVSILKAALVLLATLLCTVPARAQFIGYTSPQTFQQILATNVACTGVNQFFPVNNLGQTQHKLMIAYSSQPQTATLAFQGIDASGNIVTMSDVAQGQNVQGGTASLLSADGNFPKFQAQVNCSSAGAPTFTLTYEGASSAAANPQGSSLVTQIDKVLLSSVPANAGAASPIAITPFGNSGGQLSVQYSGGGPSGSTIQVRCGSSLQLLDSNFFQSYTFSLSASSGVQLFNVPAGPCPIYDFHYNSGGASANNVSAEYLFVPPGATNGLGASSLSAQSANGAVLSVAPGNWSVVSNPAAGSQASASRSAGATGVRHVANCVTFSSGSIVAPVLTALTVNLRDGASGAGTIIWTHEVVISAATGEDTPPVSVCGLNIVGSAATAMTLEWSAALANLSEAVSLSGYDVGP